MLTQLRRLRLLGLLGGRLLTAHGAELTNGIIREIESERAIGAEVAARQQLLTVAVLNQLERDGIAGMPLKGPFLAERLHGNSCLRRSVDIDILVNAVDMDGAIDSLELLGATRPRISPELPRLHHIFVLGNWQIELHWRVHWYEGRFSNEVLARSCFSDGVRQPAPLDDLAMLMLFHARDGLQGLRTPVDIAAGLERVRHEVLAGELEALAFQHPALRRPFAAAAIAVDAMMGTDLARGLKGASGNAWRARAAADLATWRAGVSDRELGVRTKVIDTLLAEPHGLRRALSRTLFPAVPDGANSMWRKSSYAIATATRALIILAREVRLRTVFQRAAGSTAGEPSGRPR